MVASRKDLTGGRGTERRLYRAGAIGTDPTTWPEIPPASCWNMDRRSFVGTAALLGFGGGVLNGLSTPVAAQAGSETLYLAESWPDGRSSGDGSALFEVNLDATSNEALLTHLITLPADHFDGISIAASSDGKTIYVIDTQTGHLGAYDVSTGSFTDLGAISSYPYRVTSAAFSPDGTLYAASTNDALSTIDVDNVSATVVATFDIDVFPAQIAFTSDGTLWLHNVDKTYTVDPATGTTTLVGDTLGTITGIAVRADGKGDLLYSLHGSDSIWVIDRDDGSRDVQYSMMLDGSPYTHQWGDMSIGAFADAPFVSDVVVAPNPVAEDTEVLLTATVDDSGPGDSTIIGAEYSLDGGATWDSMNHMSAEDGAFDESIEQVTATLDGFSDASVVTICVRATDSEGNTGAMKCTELLVYDPDIKFVISQNGVEHSVTPVTYTDEYGSILSVSDFYNYATSPNLYGSNTSLDIEANDQSRMFLYRDTTGLYVVFLQDDFLSAGSDIVNDRQAYFQFNGLPTSGGWVVEEGEVFDMGDGSSYYWAWTEKWSDGSAYGPLPCDAGKEFDFTVTPGFNPNPNDQTFPNSPQSVSWLAENGWKFYSDGGSLITLDPTAAVTLSCKIDSQPPITSNVIASPNPVAIDTEVLLEATIDDSGTGGSTIAGAEYSLDGGATWDLVNQTMEAVDGEFDESSETVRTVLKFATPQVATVCVRGVDSAGNIGAEECIEVAVYDPDGGFVSGAGTIHSPAGADRRNPTAEGTARFGFTSKYRKGATVPSGRTRFKFRAGDLHFVSTAYDWLVVSGKQAQFKGDGEINRTGGYGFLLTAYDGDLEGGSEEDEFRIKIWEKATDTVVYDNVLTEGDSSTPIERGRIIIKKN